MTRAEMLGAMSGPELMGWFEYDRAFGLGDNLTLLGTLGAVVARLAGNKDAQPRDFVPFLDVRPVAAPEDLGARLVAWAARQNAAAGRGSSVQ